MGSGSSCEFSRTGLFVLGRQFLEKIVLPSLDCLQATIDRAFVFTIPSFEEGGLRREFGRMKDAVEDRVAEYRFG